MASTAPPAVGQVDSTASGGMSSPAASSGPPMAPAGAPMPSPDDTPMLSAPTDYPSEPITSGLMSGPGAGPSDMLKNDTKKMQKYLPMLAPYLDQPDVPDSVRALFRYIRSQ